MKVTIQGIIKNFEGKDAQEAYLDENEKQQKRPLTVFNAIRQAILTVSETDRNMSGVDKFKLYTLAQRLKEGENDLSAEDISKIKKHVAECWTPWIMGQVWDLLEGQKEEQKTE